VFDHGADGAGPALRVFVDRGEDPEAPVTSRDADQAGRAMEEERRLGMPRRGEDDATVVTVREPTCLAQVRGEDEIADG
jgi:hypothetical protein